MSSSFQRVGRHMRGDWLKTWIASQPRSTPRVVRVDQAARGGDMSADEHGAAPYSGAG